MLEESTTPNTPPPQEPPLVVEPSTSETADITPPEMPLEAPEAPEATPVLESAEIPVSTEEIKEPEKVEEINSDEQIFETAPIEETKEAISEEIKEETKAEIKEEPQEEKPEIVAPVTDWILTFLTKARETILFRRRKKLDRIMALFLKKSQITNNNVEKLLRVSNSTASRYLSILEKEGKIKQNGKTGRGVTYSRI